MMQERTGRNGIYKWLIGGGLIVVVTVAVVASSLFFSGRPTTAQQGGLGQLFPQQGAAKTAVPGQPQVVAGAPSPDVHITWFDSVALVQWQPISGAKGYRLTLIRLRDGGIEEQVDVPASQTAFDAQGVWPNEQYQVVVQPLDSKNKPGAALYSPVGHASPINRASYNGFLDTMNIDEGPLDGSLWDENGYYGSATQSTFINNQIHGHLETGQIAEEQSLVGISPRVPFDFTNRTGTIHGEVDLHGDVSNWFGAVLAPRPIMPTEFVDTGDRNNLDFKLPMLEVFNDNNGVTLFETAVGRQPYDLGTYKPSFDYVNVRHTLDWKVSTTHVELLVDGQVAFNRALPVQLSFSVGYLTLVAESYPKQDEVVLGHVPACDDVGGACNTWHLDNWGFDAPSKNAVMPATAVASDASCPLHPTDELKKTSYCGDQSLSTTPATYKVNVTDGSPMRSAALLLSVDTFGNTPQVRVSVNNGPWLSSVYPESAYGARYTFPLDPNLLHSGDNTVRVKLASPASDDVVGYNMVVNQVFQHAYTAPALPSERSPLGAWKFGSSPHALINADALASVTCSTQQPTGNTAVSDCCGCCGCPDDRASVRRNAPVATA